MNANELADLLISTKFQVDEDGTMIGVSHQAVDEAVPMLRQQQAEIEALKSRELTDDYVFICKRCGDEIGIEYKPTELTDEEITDIGYKFGEMGLNIQMIRVILRKAQEK